MLAARPLLAKLPLLVALSLGCCSRAAATDLTFSSTAAASAAFIPALYGNDVATASQTIGGNVWTYQEGNGFTPNIGVNYQIWDLPGETLDADGQFEYYTNSGDLGVAAYSHVLDSTAELDLIPQAGYAVQLNSFDIVSFAGATEASQPVEVFDGNGDLLANFGGPMTITSTHSHFAPDIISTTGVRIEFGTNYDVGINNVNFDQVAAVPEPGTLVLLTGAAAAAVLAAIRRARRKAS